MSPAWTTITRDTISKLLTKTSSQLSGCLGKCNQMPSTNENSPAFCYVKFNRSSSLIVSLSSSWRWKPVERWNRRTSSSFNHRYLKTRAVVKELSIIMMTLNLFSFVTSHNINSHHIIRAPNMKQRPLKK